jgi:Tol biopolymer transport system component
MKNASKQALLFILVFLITTNLHSQDSPIGIFKGFTHVNNPDKRGVVGYDRVTQEYMIEGASGNMWNDIDDFHFLWKKMKGDFILQAQVELIGQGVDPHRKVGWMVRHSLEANSPQINAVVHGDGLTSLQFRKTPGGVTEEVQSENKAPDIIQLERKGDWYIMSTAKFGEPFVTTHFRDITLGNDVYIGIFLCSHNEQAVEKAIFRNVRIIVPAKADFVPYRDYIGSHIEVMDVQNGHRKILYSEPVSLQAPNWTVDGKSLIYNSNGLLYKLDLQTNQPEKINTDFATRNNNDHVLSFDGKMLGISHHSADDEGKSMVYTVPTTGGVPKKITTLGPSYLHGWSPDKKYLIYTGGRDNQYDIYRISANGGKEKKLTISKGVDDGSEYTPDGKYIYYNSTETGRMQIWRMRANGTKHEQITNDDYNNWFPHISPDGKWIVFLSYMNDVRPEDHPFYKHVYLRLMPAGGGTPKVIAYIYGGQGTINVPSWSPDSKMVSFVSNTEIK